ncbi:ACTL9 protein, partial [Psilopogon haemacephalus]|nr:ACTL9 protein [Psilopogon haemacephalus]
SEELELRTGAVVIDPGSSSCRAGFSGEQAPRAEVSIALLGCPTPWPPGIGGNKPEAFLGQDASPHPEAAAELMPQGCGTDWDAAGALWQHLFTQELRVAPEEHALLLTEPFLSPSSRRERMAELAFESLGCPGFLVAQQPVLCAFAQGRTSGLVVDVGSAVSSAVPVHEGCSLAHAARSTALAGSLLSSYLAKLLGDAGYRLGPDLLEDIKLKCCYVAPDVEAERRLPAGSYTLEYALPDGQTISLGQERFQCPEMLFAPPPGWGLSCLGIQEMAQRSLSQLPKELRPTMHRNILLCGGSSLFEGLRSRFRSELLQILPPNTQVEVAATPLGRHSAWTGASILTSLKNFQTWWIRSEEYDEEGPRIVHQRCC